MSLPQDAALDFLLERSKSLLDTHSRTWKETPVGFEEFVVKHMKGEVTERQLKDASMIFGNDPERSFTGGAPYHMLCLLAGKGSGKDTLASYMIVYCYYLCLCMRNPQEFFGFTVMDAIDMLVISYTEEQARDVNFNKIKQLFLHWDWLWDNYTVLEGDKILNQTNKPRITILSDNIVSHSNVRIKAEHSKNESFEGYNVLFWIMSEASAFEGRNKNSPAKSSDSSQQKSMTIGNGWKVFNTLRSSSSSRFSAVPGWKGFVCSYPRYDQSTDFTFQLFKSAETDNDIYADLCLPWEFKPARYYPSGKTFDFEGMMIPLEHQGDAMADPAAFKKMYLCQVPDSGEKAIPIDVFAGAMHNFPQILIIDNEVRMNMDLNQQCVVAILRGLEEVGRFQHEYLLTVDLGEKFAATGLALQHYDPDRGYILDAVGAWTPIVAKRKGDPEYPVDMDDVTAKLVMMGKVIPNVKIGYDQWNKLLLQTVLSKNSIKTVEYHVYDRDYDVFRKALSGRQAWLVDDPNHELVRQMNAMVRVGKEIVLDQRISMRKDMLDCVVGGFKVLMDKPRPPMGIPGAFYVESNLDQFGGSFVPMAPRTPWTVA